MSLSPQEIKDLESRIDYQFSSHTLLTEAFTHSSVLKSKNNYERLEFLGDLILGLCVGELLFNTFANESEGKLSIRQHSLVSGPVCCEIAKELGLFDFIRKGSEFDSAGSGKSDGILSDVFESLIAAIYLDGGIESAKSFITAMYKDRLHSQVVYNGKTLLQEWSHSQGYENPVYRLCSQEGPDHDPHFVIEASVGDIHKSVGTGNSKRSAETDAALKLLLSVGVLRRRDDGELELSES